MVVKEKEKVRNWVDDSPKEGGSGHISMNLHVIFNDFQERPQIIWSHNTFVFCDSLHDEESPYFIQV